MRNVDFRINLVNVIEIHGKCKSDFDFEHEGKRRTLLWIALN